MLSHDITYLLKVLNIGDGDSEEQLDERLRVDAEELGVDVEEQREEQQVEADDFKTYGPEYSQRSDSIDSGTSQSTDLTSHFSDTSRDPWNRPDRRSRASLSFRDYDAFVARGIPNGRQSLSFSPLTTPSHSTFSLPLSQPASPGASPKKSFRRIKGLSMLKRHSRTGSDVSLTDGCPHCPHDIISQRRAIHKLPCGHKLCTQALRSTVNSATDGATGAVPSCCGRPIPGNLVEHVMTQGEQIALLEKLEQWDEAISITPSTNSSRRDSIPILAIARPETGLCAISDESRIVTLASRERPDLQKILQREDYRLILAEQGDQRDRFLRWVSDRISSLAGDQDHLRDDMRRMHESAVETLVEGHNLAMADAEDKQVQAESDLRENHQQEHRDSGIALKHMEFYCSGTYSNGEAHNRQITPQELTELNKARHNRSQLSTKHDSQINVLRGEQSRRIRLRAQRQDRELQELKRQQRKEELELERMCTSERLRLDEDVLSKQKKVQWRWGLQMAILAKKLEGELGTRMEGMRLSAAPWSNETIPAVIPPPETKLVDRKAGTSTSFTVRSNGDFQIGAC